MRPSEATKKVLGMEQGRAPAAPAAEAPPLAEAAAPADAAAAAAEAAPGVSPLKVIGQGPALVGVMTRLVCQYRYPPPPSGREEEGAEVELGDVVSGVVVECDKVIGGKSSKGGIWVKALLIALNPNPNPKASPAKEVVE